MKKHTLDYVWNVYSNLMLHSEKNQNKVMLWRRLFLISSISTAVLGSIAGYLQVFHLCLPIFISDLFHIDRNTTTVCVGNTIVTSKIGYLLGIVSTLILSISSYFGSKIMLSDKEQIWKNSKSMAEALLSNIYRFCTNNGEYKGLETYDQNILLLEKANEYILQSENLIIDSLKNIEEKPSVDMTIDEYIQDRLIDKKENYYKANAIAFIKQLKTYERITIGLGILSVAFSSLVTVYDASVLIALITTITSTLASYYTALKLKEQKNSFNATAKQLEILMMKYKFSKKISDEQLITQTENILIAENTAWMNFWTMNNGEKKI